MTEEKKYTMLCDMIRAYAKLEEEAYNNDGKKFAEKLIKEPHNYTSYKSIVPFYGEAASLLIECKENMDKRTTKAGQLAAIKRFLSKTDYNPFTQYVFRSGNDPINQHVICDGYRMIRLFNDIPSLPHWDESKGTGIDVERVMKPVKEHAISSGVLLDLPTVAELKAFIAAHGGKKNYKMSGYVLNDCVVLDPQYLIDAIQACENIKLYKPESYFKPCYFCGDNADGIILPIRPADGEQMERIRAAYETAA